ncbi:MAG: hypothetical protein NC453_05750 [Muribaculum sp.]|nr:hypothetical protein [Muribaculum sp.]
MKKFLITTNTPTRRPAPVVWVYSFEKYLRRKLSERERSIITLLERQHHRQLKGRLPQPQLVIDPPGFDSSQLLRDYLNYRLDKLNNPDIRTVVFAPGTEYKAPNLNPQPRKKERIRYCNYRAINRLRGSTLGFMLLLNIQDAEDGSPLYSHPIRFQQLCRVFFPMQSPFGFLIMHLRLPDNVASVAKFIQHLPPAIKRHIATKPKSPDPPPPVTVITIANVLQTIGQAITTYYPVGTLHGASSPIGVAETSNHRRT